MHKDARDAILLAQAIRAHVENMSPEMRTSVILCPPFTALESVRRSIEGCSLLLGAQNVHEAESGAYTGEISAGMLVAAGCTHVIIGHSERRLYFKESDGHINKKMHAALRHPLSPILCVGEMLEQRERGTTRSVIDIQLREALAGMSEDSMRRSIIAYEPVWAIGTGRTATPEQAQEVHEYIRCLISSLYGPDIAEAMIIVYGGSVKSDNARELFSQPDVDGGLVGGASLDAPSFISIINACGGQ